jgi:tRNA (adenine57-N1/adenine58-N1)-methyltransferase
MTSTSPRYSSGPFRWGDRVQITGPKGKMNAITLETQKVFHSHRGAIPHERIVGLPDGSVIANDSGIPHLVLRPLLSDFVMGMPRGAAIIYPKDAQAILGQADIFPGARVVEAGVGSGALSLWLLRAIGPSGHLFSFERRQEFADVATANGVTYFGHAPANWTITIGDLQDSLGEVVESATADRVVLDMLAPWECVESVANALIPGGVVLCYVATVTQLSRTVEAFRASDRFTNPVSSETMIRGWHVEGLAVRPEHRMTGHTGFLMTARLLAPGADLPELKRRASKSDFEDSDVEAWTPGALADRQVSDKVLRKRLRAAEDSARLSADSHEESR